MHTCTNIIVRQVTQHESRWLPVGSVAVLARHSVISKLAGIIIRPSPVTHTGSPHGTNAFALAKPILSLIQGKRDFLR